MERHATEGRRPERRAFLRSGGAVFGGGPGGCSASVFCATGGLDTDIFDCGGSSLQRGACLENYPDLPVGIDDRRREMTSDVEAARRATRWRD